jgi:sulfur carrier protein
VVGARVLLNWRQHGGASPLPVDTKLAVEISVNGEAQTTHAASLAELVAELELTGRVATARNGDFVPERARAETPLERGDRIEIVSPRHGG